MFGFLVAVLAGYLTPRLDAPVAKPLARAISEYVEVEVAETRLVSFMVAMLAAAVLADLLDSGSAFWVILGGVIGYFLTRLIAAGRTALDQRGPR